MTSGKVEDDPNSDEVQYLALDTIAHEASHLIHHDSVAPTFDDLYAEYYTWYVGEFARTGKEPTKGDAIGGWPDLLEPNGWYFDHAADGALHNSVEASQIFEELPTLTGVPVNMPDYKQVLAISSRWRNSHLPAPVQSNNLDNY